MLDDVDVINEAAFVPERWTDVLRRLADKSRSIGSTVFLLSDSGQSRGRTLPNLEDLMAEFLAVDTLRFSTSVVRMCSVKPNSFVTVEDYLTEDEIRDDPIRIRLRALGIGAHICTAMPMPSGEIVIYVLQKPLGGEPYQPAEAAELDRLRPHLARAGLLAARLGLENARGSVAAMEALGLPAAVLSDARVLAANSLFEALSDTVLLGPGGRVALAQGGPNDLLQSACRAMAGSPAAVRSIPVRAEGGRPAFVAHVLPLRRAAQDIFFGGDTLLAFTAISPSAIVPSPTILSGLFDLTPAEARLATSLASGRSLRDAATDSRIQVSTARSYLEKIFRKTGTNQQSQLVALLKSTDVVQRPDG